VEPNSGRTFISVPASFRLVRASHIASDHLKVNYTLDIQRNRVETACALKRAMEETDYSQSVTLLKAQVEKIKVSVSAQDPFCQKLVNDLQYTFPTERAYRSSQQQAYRSHETERGTYNPSANTSSQLYLSPQQKAQVAHFMNK
jgi:hypothetical protein